MCVRILMCLVLLSAARADGPAGVATQLDTREKQLENLYADYWRTEYKIAMGEQNLSSRPIQEQIRAVVSDDAFLRDLEHANFSNPLLEKRRKLFLNEAVYTKITNDPSLTAVVERITQQENTMKMISAGAGLGVGVKDYRVIFVFANEKAFTQFLDSGWSGSAQTDAAAKAGDKGAAYSGAVEVAPGVWVYQITKNGLALQLTLQGTKYYKDDDLNKKS